MKTTFDLPEALLRDVQRLARARGTTAKSLVEQALLRLLQDEQTGAAAFTLCAAAVNGEGLTSEFADASWDDIRAATYGLRT